MVQSMLFTNCVKEQCYHEEEEEEEKEENGSKQTHTHTHAHNRSRSRIRYKRSTVSGGSLFYLPGLATGS